MKVINLFAGAGSGKSTTAAGLFFLMKTKHMSVELINEFAKTLVWSERKKTFEDQLYLLAKQNHKIFTLKGKVDYVISDSPLLLSRIYCPPNFIPGFYDFVNNVFNTYDNLNFFIRRVKPYNPVGRNETEAGAREKDAEIKYLLTGSKIKFIEVDGDSNAPQKILDTITKGV